jgi:hypothetical protein
LRQSGKPSSRLPGAEMGYVLLREPTSWSASRFLAEALAVTATDAAGNARTVRRTIRVRR